MTAVWGLTFVQVKDAVAVYPLFLFLAVRFAIACGVLAPFALPRLRTSTGARSRAASRSARFLAAGYAFQTVGLDRTTVSRRGLHHRPLRAADAALRARCSSACARRGPRGSGPRSRPPASRCSRASTSGRSPATLLLVGCAAVFALEIVFMERFSPGSDALAFTFVQMLVCLVSLGAIALVRDPLEAPHGWTVWSALVVTGIVASALAFLVQTWAQQTTSAMRTALIFALEPVFAGIFGFLHGDRLGWLGWSGCAVDHARHRPLGAGGGGAAEGARQSRVA